MSTLAYPAAKGRPQSIGEEIANAASHGLGALASIAFLPAVVAAASRGGARPWPYAVFGAALIILFSSSAAYHAVSEPRLKRKLRFLDHATIYVLIAGTYSAYSLGVLGGAEGRLLFALAWGIAAVGIALSGALMERFRLAGPLIYLAMGWLIAPFMGDMRRALPPESFALLIAGGLSYTLGVAFYAVKRVPYFHAVWHLFVLAGAACHAASILLAA